MPTRRPVLRSSFVEGFFHDLEEIDGPGAADWQASLTQRLLGLAALGLDGHERRIGRMVLSLRGREGMLYVLYWRRDGYFRPGAQCLAAGLRSDAERALRRPGAVRA